VRHFKITLISKKNYCLDNEDHIGQGYYAQLGFNQAPPLEERLVNEALFNTPLICEKGVGRSL
jgi:hypothetical protein